MGNISVEKKMELVRNIREQSNHNSRLMQAREQILGGSAAKGSYAPEEEESLGLMGFKFRLFTAILLFFLFVVADYAGLQVGNVKTADISKQIRYQVDIKSFDFISKIPYTNVDDTNSESSLEE